LHLNRNQLTSLPVEWEAGSAFVLQRSGCVCLIAHHRHRIDRGPGLYDSVLPMPPMYLGPSS
jgi:hypothetical protein